MKFGLMYNTGIYGTDPDQMIAVARHAEQHTRWGTIDMTADDVAAHAGRGTTRLVVGPASTDLAEQEDQVSAFAARLALLR